ncbi:MAG: hypothetical protein ACREDO_00720 [Methyloceanibacter sp.]
MAVFAIVCLGVSNLLENLGVATGFPFGPYHNTDLVSRSSATCPSSSARPISASGISPGWCSR